jgi:hypothetical protein
MTEIKKSYSKKREERKPRGKKRDEETEGRDKNKRTK